MHTEEQHEERHVAEEQAMTERLRAAQAVARRAAEEWRRVAVEATTLRDNTPATPDMPCCAEEWFEDREAKWLVPFDLDELHRDRRQLNGFIHRAWTLHAIYTEEALRMERELADISAYTAKE